MISRFDDLREGDDERVEITQRRGVATVLGILIPVCRVHKVHRTDAGTSICNEFQTQRSSRRSSPRRTDWLGPAAHLNINSG